MTGAADRGIVESAAAVLVPIVGRLVLAPDRPGDRPSPRATPSGGQFPFEAEDG